MDEFKGKKIQGYEGLYWINNAGEIYSGYCGRTLRHMYDEYGRAYVQLVKCGVPSIYYISDLLKTYYPRGENIRWYFSTYS